MFRRNLWQKNSALRMIDDQEPMATNLNGFRKNWFQRREQRNLDAHLLQVRLFHGSEARIFQGSAYRTAHDSLAQRFLRFRHSNASLQAASHMNCDKNPAALGENSVTRYNIRNLAV